MSLIAETDLSETKMALLETVRVTVVRLESKTEPYASGIMSMLPPLWAASGEEHLMKQVSQFSLPILQWMDLVPSGRPHRPGFLPLSGLHTSYNF
jgi:hypothetical protein